MNCPETPAKRCELSRHTSKEILTIPTHQQRDTNYPNTPAKRYTKYPDTPAKRYTNYPDTPADILTIPTHQQRDVNSPDTSAKRYPDTPAKRYIHQQKDTNYPETPTKRYQLTGLCSACVCGLLSLRAKQVVLNPSSCPAPPDHRYSLMV